MKILVALSGGVDSAVAAWKLHCAGHEVHAAYMKNWMEEDDPFGECPWKEDIEDAQAVCKQFGIPFTVTNFMHDYRRRVVDYLVEGYRRGLTPNPDVMCNREIKFGVFREYALERGFEGVATGHYARLGPEHSLHEGADPEKDQSYFLSLLRADQLAQAIFPLGELTKPEVRVLARQAGLPNASKKDSQGICFMGKVRINDFLRRHIPDAPGPIVEPSGRILGEHRGLHHYTLGQRKGIGLPSNTDHQHFVVVSKDFAQNSLHIAFDRPETPGLFQREMHLQGLSWTTLQPPDPSAVIEARPRYRDPRVKVEFTLTSANTARIRFAQPQRALAGGQICALHHGSQILGAGVFLPPGHTA